MGDVHEIRMAPDQRIVDQLEELLTEAKAGDLHRIDMVASYGGVTRTLQIGRGNRMEIIGQLEYLKFTVCATVYAEDEASGPGASPNA